MQKAKNEEFVTHTTLAEQVSAIRQHIASNNDASLNRMQMAADAQIQVLQQQITAMQEQMRQNETSHKESTRQMIADIEKRFGDKLRTQGSEYETMLDELRLNQQQQASNIDKLTKKISSQNEMITSLQSALQEKNEEIKRMIDQNSVHWRRRHNEQLKTFDSFWRNKFNQFVTTLDKTKQKHRIVCKI